tara:strand:- start:3003 stop:3839 length:837 start_codon:yes stop_codon:yes gene_type:complete
MAWFKRKDKKIKEKNKKSIPDGLWEKCPSCNEILFKPELNKSLFICHHCNYHFRMDVENYLNLLIDKGSSTRLYKSLKSKNFLNFTSHKSYDKQLTDNQKKLGETEAIEIYAGNINSVPVIIGIMNFNFIGGSMGSVVGELVSRAITTAGKERKPLIIICKSGGARMQEGAISLMQLAKTSSQLAKFSNNGGLFISILTDPTTGGVTASYGMLGDIIIAEPGALIGFAGPRVIKQTIGQDLPKGFQRSEFLLEKGFIDIIVDRTSMKDKLFQIIKILT